jgi:hypothetical protein
VVALRASQAETCRRQARRVVTDPTDITVDDLVLTTSPAPIVPQPELADAELADAPDRSGKPEPTAPVAPEAPDASTPAHDRIWTVEDDHVNLPPPPAPTGRRRPGWLARLGRRRQPSPPKPP